MPDLKVLFAIGTISSLAVLAGSIIAPIEARYIQRFTDDPLIIGTVFGVGSVFVAVLSFYLGRLSDRVGRRRVILLGLVFGIIYALLYSVVLNVFQIYGVKFAWAFSAVATGPLIATYLQDFLEPYEKKGMYFGYVYSAQSISGSIGALIGGYFASEYGLQAPFYAVAGIFFVSVLLATILLPKRAMHNPSASHQKRSLSMTQAFRYIFSKPALLFYLCVNTSTGVNWGIKAFLWPLIIFDLAQDDFVTGSIFATMGVVAFLLLPFAGKVVDVFGSYRSILVELVILGVTGIGMVLANDVSVFWIFAALYTVGEVLNGPAQAVLLTENVESDVRGTVMGLDASMDQMLGVFAPLIAGGLITVFGLTATLGVFIGLYWVSLFIASILYPRIARA